MSELCRGCGGTGIGPGVSPRVAAQTEVPILMRKPDGSGATVIVRVSYERKSVRLKFEGPLMAVLAHIAQRESAKYRIVSGDRPDPSIACEWCNGYGSPEGQLTARALERLASSAATAVATASPRT